MPVPTRAPKKLVMLLPPESENWTVRKRRWHERCWVCSQKCMGNGIELSGLARVCRDCYDTIVDDGYMLLMKVIGRPFITYDEVNQKLENKEPLI